MRILIIKLSSLGDIVHTFPLIDELKNNFPQATIEWLVDNSFIDVVQLHSSIDNIHTVNLRQHNIRYWQIFNYILQLRKKLKNLGKFDIVIDCQGLIKSSICTCFIQSTHKIGFSYSSAREPLSSLFYHQKIFVDKNLHAIQRLRLLGAKGLNYINKIDMQQMPVSHNTILQQSSTKKLQQTKKLLFLHCTTWHSKKWPFWSELCKIALAQGYIIYLNSGNAEEFAAGEQIAATITHNNQMKIMPRLSMQQYVKLFTEIDGVVSCDTGIGHLAAVYNLPIVGLYGPTSPVLAGIKGKYSTNLYPRQDIINSDFQCVPCKQRKCSHFQYDNFNYAVCFKFVTATNVWQQLQQKIQSKYKA